MMAQRTALTVRLWERTRSVHEVADPEVVDVVHFKGFPHIGALLDREPPLGFDHPQEGVVVDRGIPQEPLIPKLLVEFLCGVVRVGLALDFDHLEPLLIQAPGSSPI
jgi:hypothetical protein